MTCSAFRGHLIAPLVSSAVLLLIACSASYIQTSESARNNPETVASQLRRAERAHDRSVEPLVRIVLMDALEQNFNFNHGIVELACRLVFELRLDGLVPLVRRLAGMEYPREPSAEQTEVIEVIEGALWALARNGDPQAEKLNLARLDDDPWLQVAAVYDLQLLRAWEAVPDVLQLLRARKSSPENLLLHRTIVEYLSLAPSVPDGTCSEVRGIVASYRRMFSDGTVRDKLGMVRLERYADDLCPASRPSGEGATRLAAAASRGAHEVRKSSPYPVSSRRLICCRVASRKEASPCTSASSDSVGGSSSTLEADRAEVPGIRRPCVPRRWRSRCPVRSVRVEFEAILGEIRADLGVDGRGRGRFSSVFVWNRWLHLLSAGIGARTTHLSRGRSASFLAWSDGSF